MRFCWLFVILGGGMHLAGCGRSQDPTPDPTSFGSRVAVERLRARCSNEAFPGVTNSAVAVFSAAVDNPVFNGGTVSELVALRRFVGSLMPEGGWNPRVRQIATPEEGIRYVRDAFFEKYSKDLSDPSYADPKAPDSLMYSWELNVDGRKVYDDARFVSYRIRFHMYYGGVHPDVDLVNGVFGRREGRRLKPEDFFEERNMLKVLNLLRVFIARNHKDSSVLREYEDHLEKTPYSELVEAYKKDPHFPILTDNFFLDEEGMTWTFPEYQLSSYSDGTPQGTIPWKYLKPYLKDLSIIPEMVAESSALDKKIEGSDPVRVGNLMFY